MDATEKDFPLYWTHTLCVMQARTADGRVVNTERLRVELLAAGRCLVERPTADRRVTELVIQDADGPPDCEYDRVDFFADALEGADGPPDYEDDEEDALEPPVRRRRWWHVCA